MVSEWNRRRSSRGRRREALILGIVLPPSVRVYLDMSARKREPASVSNAPLLPNLTVSP